MTKKKSLAKNIVFFSSYLFIVWGLARSLLKLPDMLEEAVLKPLIFLTPLFYFVNKSKIKVESLGLNGKNLPTSIFLSIIFSAFFVIGGTVLSWVKYAGYEIAFDVSKNSILFVLLASLVGALSDEITFRGYLFGRSAGLFEKEILANFSMSFVWALIHVPVVIFWWELEPWKVLFYFVLTYVFGVASTFVFAKTKNVVGCIILNFFWKVPIILGSAVFS